MKKTTLVELFDSSDWERKFENQIPDRNILFAFHNGDERKAESVLKKLEEETEEYCRALFLGSDSLGTVLCVTEEEWD